MPTLNVELELFQKIWALLLADTDWAAAVDAANRLRDDEVDGHEVPWKYITADGDYPQVRLRLIGGSNSLHHAEGEVTFQTHSPEGPSHWIEHATHTFRLRTVSKLYNVGETTSLGSITRNAIRKGGPRLGGLPYVTTVRLEFESSEQPDDENGSSMLREMSDLTIRIATEVDGATLL